MAAVGRPTTQHPNAEDTRPRFRDQSEEGYLYPESNPHVAAHRDFGELLLPASEAWRYYGRWHECFHREAPLHVDLGSGNGFFLEGLAKAHPEWNVMGIELRYKRTTLSAKKLEKAELRNGRVCRYHLAYLDDLFAPGTVSGLYVNHPDPWPKARHEGNRLISRWFLEDAARILAPQGILRIKSDFADNIDRIPRLLQSDDMGNPQPLLPFKIVGRSDNIQQDGAPWENDIQTNYQRKFNDRNLPVLGMELVRTP